MEILVYGGSHSRREKSGRVGLMETGRPSKDPQRLKVVHLITLLELGGAQGNTLFTVKNLSPKYFDAYLLAGSGAILDDRAIQDISSSRLFFLKNLVRPIRPLKDLLAILEIRKTLKKIKPAILHTHSSKAGILGRIAGKLAGVPFIVHTFHGFGFNNQQKSWTRRFFVFLERFCARLSTKLIFVSQSNWNEALDKKIGQRDQYELIRSGIDLADIRDRTKRTDVVAMRSALGLSHDSLVVTTVGPFKPQKNHLEFVRMAKLVYEKEPRARFLVVGDGALRPDIELEIKRQNMDGVIQLLGWRNDIPEILAITDVFALTSLWEGLPRSMVEALAVRVPCVCYDTDGVRDLLTMGGGFIAPQKNPQWAAEKVFRLLVGVETPSFPQTLKEKIDSEFDIRQMTKDQEALYVKIIDNQS